jgi:hypothetical protein
VRVLKSTVRAPLAANSARVSDPATIPDDCIRLEAESDASDAVRRRADVTIRLEIEVSTDDGLTWMSCGSGECVGDPSRDTAIPMRVEIHPTRVSGGPLVRVWQSVRGTVGLSASSVVVRSYEPSDRLGRSR